MGEAETGGEVTVRDRGGRSDRGRGGGREGRKGRHKEGGQEGEEKGKGRGGKSRPHSHF